MICQILQAILSFAEIGFCYWACDILGEKGELRKNYKSFLGGAVIIIGGVVIANRQLIFYSYNMLACQILLICVSLIIIKKKVIFQDVCTVLNYNLLVALFQILLAQAAYYFLKTKYLTEFHYKVGIFRILVYAISILCVVGIFCFIRKVIKCNNFEMKEFQGAVIWFIAGEILLLIWFQSQLMDQGFKHGARNAFYLLLFLFGLGFFAYIYQRIIKYKLLMEMTQINNKMLEKNYREMEQIYKNGLCATHDIRNHIVVLRELLGQEEIENAKEYLKKIGEPIELLERYIFCGNRTINLILNSKMVEASNHGIEVTTDIQQIRFSRVEDWDLCSILSNLLDNAIEACELVSDDDRWIRVAIKEQGEMGMICIKNSTASRVEKRGGKYTSRKANLILHGYGMKSVEEKVEKYNGVIQWDSTDKVFSAMITFFEK